MSNVIVTSSVLVFPTIGMPVTKKSELTFPTVWRSDYGGEETLPSGEKTYLIDADGNLLVDSNGAYLTVNA